MTNKHFLIGAVAAMLASCGGPATYTFNGKFTDASMDGKEVFLLQSMEHGTDTISKAIVKGDAFTFTGEAPKTPVFYTITDDKVFDFQLISEAGELQINIDKTKRNPTFVGGALNEKISTIDQKLKDIVKAFDDFYRANPKDRKAIMEAYMKMQEDNTTFLREQMMANKDNLVGAYCLESHINKYETIAKVDSILALVPQAAEMAGVKRHRNALIAMEKTEAGKMFVDFKGTDIEGKSVSLSDYVGKGNYVLVDFWASWCGPCKAEMPNLKAVYDQYKDKGFVLLGVNVWERQKENFFKAIKEEGMTWKHIYASDSRDATDLYGIKGIPTIILFGPDGKIVDRTLRGQAIKDKLAEIYK